MIPTRFTELVGCTEPIQRAGMALGLANAHSAAAVANTAALGIVSTSGADAGCDFVVAQGIAVGGHVRGRIGLPSLLDQVLGAVDVPVLAAGGVGSGRALAAVLKAGADGARVGTRFLAAPEANTHPVYLQALIEAQAEATVYTEAFSVGWPNAPHRVLRSCLEAAEAHPQEIVGECVRVATGARWPLRRFESCDIHDRVTGTIEAMPHWAGCSRPPRPWTRW